MTESRYFIPGPTWVRPEILAELTHPMVGHRSADFKQLARQILSDVKELFGTRQHAFVATSSGTGVLEGAMINCVPRSVLVTTCGAFSERWLSIAQQLGLEADRLSVPWGESIDPTRLADHLRGRHHHYDAVTITHSETSTGVMNDVQALAAVIREASPDSLILVDAVSSLGSARLLFDEWNLDVCVASTQKGIALPPGLTVFAVSEKAMACAARKPYRGTYFDFLEFQKNLETGGIPFTPAIPLYYALAAQLSHILRSEGLENRWNRHEEMRRITREKTAPYAEPSCPVAEGSMSVTALRPKQGSAPDVVAAMKKRGFVLGGGYGKWKEETFRIGHMGDITVTALEAMLEVLGEVCMEGSRS